MSSLQQFDHYKETYRSDIDKAVAFSGQSHEFFTRVKAEYLIELLTAHRASPQTNKPIEVLDVGCGHGHIHPYLVQSDLKIKLAGADVAASVLEEARLSNPSVEYRPYDGLQLPYENRSFDAAYAIAVMHHVPPAQWLNFLEEMRRVVRPGGLIAIFEHNPINPLTQWIVRTCPIDEKAVLIGSRKLRDLMARAELVDIAGNYIVFTPIDGEIYRRFDRMIGWLPFGAQYYVSAHVPDAA
jgi:SAM-dependent methyltransferase